MYEFMDRLVSVALPRVRDFRGLNKNSFDGRGNYTIGKEQLIFPEINLDKIEVVRGMDITFVTTARSDEEDGNYRLMGMPFAKQEKMAKTSKKVSQRRKAKFSTREYNRCKICGRPHGYLRKYGICRICFKAGIQREKFQASEKLVGRRERW